MKKLAEPENLTKLFEKQAYRLVFYAIKRDIEELGNGSAYGAYVWLRKSGRSEDGVEISYTYGYVNRICHTLNLVGALEKSAIKGPRQIVAYKPTRQGLNAYYKVLEKERIWLLNEIKRNLTRADSLYPGLESPVILRNALKAIDLEKKLKQKYLQKYLGE